MVLDIPGGLFGQSDVRETATEEGTVTGTLYWSCSGDSFTTSAPDVDNITKTNGYLRADAANISCIKGVNLPHGAVITAVVVEGNAAAAAEIWYLNRYDKGDDDASSQVQMATANINTEDSSITNGTIDNENYVYSFITSSLDTNDRIGTARIKYTL